MLGLFGPKSTHPLADGKEGKRILASLASAAPSACLDETSAWFESLAGLDDIAPMLRYRRIVELAALSLPHVRRLGREVLAEMQVDRHSARQAWERHQGYWTHLAGALERCKADVDGSPKVHEAFRPHLGALLAGLLIARFGAIRWSQLRYLAIDNDLWASLGQLYWHAVGEKIAEQPVKPFGDTEAGTSVVGEYLKILIFRASSMDNLAPQEISLAERFIAHFEPLFVLSADPRPDSAYWVDAAKPMPPVRMANPPQASPTLRFFGPGPALEAAQQMRARIAATQMVPDVNLGGQFPTDLLLSVLDHLLRCWSPEAPMRNFPRHRVKSTVGACIGYEALRQALTDPDSAAAQSWQAEDVSQGGMSVRLPLARNGQITIGTLVGLQPEGGSNWLAGVVRRFVREADGHGVAGIETLSKSPRAVTGTDGAMQTDLVLLDVLRHDTSARVLLQPGNWEPGMPMQLFIDGHPWRIYPDETLEASEDWLVGRCIIESLDPR